MSIEVTTAQFERVSKHLSSEKIIYMYNEKGIYEVCRHSRQSISDKFYDWVYETIGSIRKNGYYIATEKDNKWLGIREDGKLDRRELTDGIKQFIEYAKESGSKSYEMYYKHFTKLIYDKLGIPKGLKRDDMNQRTLMDIAMFERLISMKLPKLVNENTYYKEIYQEIKRFIKSI